MPAATAAAAPGAAARARTPDATECGACATTSRGARAAGPPAPTNTATPTATPARASAVVVSTGRRVPVEIRPRRARGGSATGSSMSTRWDLSALGSQRAAAAASTGPGSATCSALTSHSAGSQAESACSGSSTGSGHGCGSGATVAGVASGSGAWVVVTTGSGNRFTTTSRGDRLERTRPSSLTTSVNPDAIAISTPRALWRMKQARPRSSQTTNARAAGFLQQHRERPNRHEGTSPPLPTPSRPPTVRRPGSGARTGRSPARSRAQAARPRPAGSARDRTERP